MFPFVFITFLSSSLSSDAYISSVSCSEEFLFCHLSSPLELVAVILAYCRFDLLHPGLYDYLLTGSCDCILLFLPSASVRCYVTVHLFPRFLFLDFIRFTLFVQFVSPCFRGPGFYWFQGSSSKSLGGVV